MTPLNGNKYMNRLWSKLHDLFDTNDGSLPDIELGNLTASEIKSIYAYLRFNSKMVSHKSCFWSTIAQEEVPIDSVENAASLVLSGEAESFHIVIGELFIGGAVIPDLGIAIFQNSIILDYRMGEEWGNTELESLFILFSKIRELAPLVNIEYQTNCCPEVHERFKRELMNY
jgi:hypothetical protein